MPIFLKNEQETDKIASNVFQNRGTSEEGSEHKAWKPNISAVELALFLENKHTAESFHLSILVYISLVKNFALANKFKFANGAFQFKNCICNLSFNGQVGNTLKPPVVVEMS